MFSASICTFNFIFYIPRIRECYLFTGVCLSMGKGGTPAHWSLVSGTLSCPESGPRSCPLGVPLASKGTHSQEQDGCAAWVLCLLCSCRRTLLFSLHFNFKWKSKSAECTLHFIFTLKLFSVTLQNWIWSKNWNIPKKYVSLSGQNKIRTAVQKTLEIYTL